MSNVYTEDYSISNCNVTGHIPMERFTLTRAITTHRGPLFTRTTVMQYIYMHILYRLLPTNTPKWE